MEGTMAKALTDRTIKALKAAPAGKRTERWDSVVSGLGVRVTDTGAKSFVLNARFPGSHNSARRALGGYGELTLEQARNKARSWLELLGRGIDPRIEIERQQAAELRTQATTFAAVAEKFITEKLPGERRGRDAELHLRRVFIPRWGKRPIVDITRTDVKAVIDEIKRPTPVMAHALFGTGRRLFNWAIEQGDYGLEQSPFDHLKAKSLIGALEPRDRILSDDEIRAFWKACLQMGYPHGDLGRFLLLTGVRHFEAAEAPWSEFNLPGATWTIDKERFKSKSGHLVPLSGDALELLNGLPRFQSGPHLFSFSFGKRGTDIGERPKLRLDELMFAELVELRGKDAELKPWRIHDLRRTMRSRLSALQVPDVIAELILGHAKRGLQRVYDQHRYEDEMRQALEKWAARLRSIIIPPPANVVALRSSAA
jgi:integrase